MTYTNEIVETDILPHIDDFLPGEDLALESLK